MTSRPVGTLAWAEKDKGELRLRDYFTVLGKGLSLFVSEMPGQASSWMGLTKGMSLTNVPTRLSVPTVASTRAEKACRRLSPAFLVNHSHRTYAWAKMLATYDDVAMDVDDELLYVSCLLHDLGLSLTQTPHLLPGCFTLVGARALRQIGTAAGWEEKRILAGEEAITLHMNPRVPLKQGLEAHLLTRASQLDAVGIGRWRIAEVCRNRIFRLYPRGGAEKDGFTALFDKERHPAGSRARLYWFLGSRWWFHLDP